MDTVTIYERPSGPICYEKQIIIPDDDNLANRLGQQLLLSGLNWYWESTPSHTDSEYYSTGVVPPQRSLTILGPDNLSNLINDLKETDLDNYGRFVALFGKSGEGLDMGNFNESLRSFTVEECSPIRIALIRIGDVLPQFIFVPHQPVSAVTRLLEQWGIAPSSPAMKRSYEKLHLAKLESLYEFY